MLPDVSFLQFPSFDLSCLHFEVPQENGGERGDKRNVVIHSENRTGFWNYKNPMKHVLKQLDYKVLFSRF